MKASKGLPPEACKNSPAVTKRFSFSDPLVSPPSQQEQLRIRPGTVFLLPCMEVFAYPWLAAPLQPPQKQYPQRQQKLPMRIYLCPRLLFSRGHCSGRSLVEAAYASGFQLVLARQQYPVLQHRCTLCTVPVYKPLCMQ